jgi:hypothetical protein
MWEAKTKQSGAVDEDGAAMTAKKRSRPVSRVLFVLRRDSHSSRPGVTARL